MTQEAGVQAQSYIGLTLGNVRLVNVLGQGGMGTVYRGEHVVLKTPYAVKLLHTELTQDAVLNERFRREAVVCSKLRHPNIVFLTDFGFHKDVGLYIVMEFLEGKSLFGQMQQKALRLEQVVDVAKQACEGLAAAHKHEILHRDLKPENIFLVDSSSDKLQVKVLDFGIARTLTDQGPRLTEKGMVMGTPEYLAPEHIQGGRNVGPSADLYSMGLIIYEMLTHRLPFEGGDPMQVFYQHVMAQPKPLSAYRPELEGTLLETLVSDMLAKLPQERPGDALDVVARLDEAFEDLQARRLVAHKVQERNHSGHHNAMGALSTSQGQMSGVVQLLQNPTQQTRLTKFFHMMPQLAMLPPEMFFSASWGLLLQDLREHDMESEAFEETLLHLVKLLEDFVQRPVESGQDDPVEVVKQTVSDLLKILDSERQARVITALQPLKSHPRLSGLFTQESSEGRSWGSLRDMLNRDVRDLFPGRKK